MNDMSEIPLQVQQKLLHKNLNKTLGLVNIHGFNMIHLKDELDFVFSDHDLKQFKV